MARKRLRRTTPPLIDPLLRVASEVEPKRPRVAYLCRFYAYEKAHRLDPASIGRGVRQRLLLQRLERENASSLSARVKKSDAREITSFYHQYYDHYVKAVQEEQVDRAQVIEARNTLDQLYEVLCWVNKPENLEEVAPELDEVDDRGIVFSPLCHMELERQPREEASGLKTPCPEGGPTMDVDADSVDECRSDFLWRARKPVKKPRNRRECCSCSSRSTCRTGKCGCHAKGRVCGATCSVRTKCLNTGYGFRKVRKTVKKIRAAVEL